MIEEYPLNKKNGSAPRYFRVGFFSKCCFFQDVVANIDSENMMWTPCVALFDDCFKLIFKYIALL